MIPFHRVSMRPLALEQLKTLNDTMAKGDTYERQIKESFIKNSYPPEYCDTMLLTHSATASLELMALAIAIKQGDEVIMPSFTYAATANAFAKFGAVIKFIDIEPLTLNLDPAKVEAAITPKTRAVVPIHYGGIAANMDALKSVIKKASEKLVHGHDTCQQDKSHKIYLCEDASHTIGACYEEKPLGTVGDLGCISFHHTKNITSGGSGGCLFTNSAKLGAIAEEALYQGTNRVAFMNGEVSHYHWQRIGGAYDMPVMQQAMLLQALTTLKDVTQMRREKWYRYQTRLMPLFQKGHIRLAVLPKYASINGHIFYIRVNDPTQRDSLMTWLQQQKIETRTHYEPLHTTTIGTKVGVTSGDLAVTNDTVKTLIRLPLYDSMTDAEQDAVIKAIFEFYK